jgi:hypothetical protein
VALASEKIELLLTDYASYALYKVPKSMISRLGFIPMLTLWMRLIATIIYITTVSQPN